MSGGMDAVPSVRHLAALSDDVGLFEHAEFTRPRPEHGYCVDDVARGLAVLCRGPVRDDEVATAADLTRRYLAFVIEAQAPDGRVVNRRDVQGRWHGEPGVQDWWGRALWGLATAAARSSDPAVAAPALEGFERGAGLRSPWPCAMAFAGLGAAEVVAVDPDHAAARALLADAAVAVGPVGTDPRWPWPQPRLRYANAAVPEVLVAAGDLLGDRAMLEDGLRLLEWLLSVETVDDHLSPTPVDGWSLGEPRPGFDQQPIEVAALADACARALAVTGDPRWACAVEQAAAWFTGANDAGADLTDPVSGGGCDGLEATGRNENQGAESTLALLSTMQLAALQSATRLAPAAAR